MVIIDEQVVERVHSYLRNHIIFTEIIHAVLGFGIALLLVEKWRILGFAAVCIGSLGHVWAYLKGSKYK